MPLKKQNYEGASRPKPTARQKKVQAEKPKVEKPKLTRPNLAKRQITEVNAVVSETVVEEAEESNVVVPFEPLTEFTLFRDLPPELRIRIWRFSPNQRFIGLKFDKSRFKLPAIFHINRESRHEAKKHVWSLNMPEWGIIANPAIDILYLDSSSFSDKFAYHQSATHALNCGTAFDHSHLKEFTNISITLKEILTIWRRDCLHCYFKEKFLQVLPDVTEVNVMLRPGQLGAEPSDMWIVDDEDADTLIDCHRTFIDDVKSIWKRVLEEDQRYEKITLNFVRVERWTR